MSKYGSLDRYRGGSYAGYLNYELPSGGGGGGSTIITQDEGVVVDPAATTLNFVGDGVTATDAGGNITTVTIPGGGGGGTIDPTVVDGVYYSTRVTVAGGDITALETDGSLNDPIFSKNNGSFPMGTLQPGNGSICLGNGAAVSTAIGANDVAIGPACTITEPDSQAIGSNNNNKSVTSGLFGLNNGSETGVTSAYLVGSGNTVQNDSDRVAALGTTNTFLQAITNSAVVGHDNFLDGSNLQVQNRVFVLGANNTTSSAVQEVVVLGDENDLSDTASSVFIAGSRNDCGDGLQNATIIGQDNVWGGIAGGESICIGVGNTGSNNNGGNTAIGHQNSVVNNPSSVPMTVVGRRNEVRDRNGNAIVAGSRNSVTTTPVVGGEDSAVVYGIGNADDRDPITGNGVNNMVMVGIDNVVNGNRGGCFGIGNIAGESVYIVGEANTGNYGSDSYVMAQGFNANVTAGLEAGYNNLVLIGTKGSLNDYSDVVMIGAGNNATNLDETALKQGLAVVGAGNRSVDCARLGSIGFDHVCLGLEDETCIGSGNDIDIPGPPLVRYSCVPFVADVPTRITATQIGDFRFQVDIDTSVMGSIVIPAPIGGGRVNSLDITCPRSCPLSHWQLTASVTQLDGDGAGDGPVIVNMVDPFSETPEKAQVSFFHTSANNKTVIIHYVIHNPVTGKETF